MKPFILFHTSKAQWEGSPGVCVAAVYSFDQEVSTRCLRHQITQLKGMLTPLDHLQASKLLSGASDEPPPLAEHVFFNVRPYTTR